MPATKSAKKVECLHPTTGSRMSIDAATYELFSKTIYHSLMGGKKLTFTQMIESIEDCFQKQEADFHGSVGWYAVAVKNDMQAKGILDVVSEKGKKLHHLTTKARALKTRHDR